MIATAPRDKNKTKQDYGTPSDFFGRVNHFLPFVWDLAATSKNTKCENYISPEQDSLKWNWNQLARGKWLWLNPPFADILPWAMKCVEESALGAKMVMLTPASVDTIWYREFVWDNAVQVFLNGRGARLKFDGSKPNKKTGKIDPYPNLYFGSGGMSR